MILARVRPSVVAVSCALQFGPQPCRLMAIETRFPDVGSPTSEKIGFLRYSGEAILGDAEPVAAGPTPDHNL